MTCLHVCSLTFLAVAYNLLQILEQRHELARLQKQLSSASSSSNEEVLELRQAARTLQEQLDDARQQLEECSQRALQVHGGHSWVPYECVYPVSSPFSEH